MQAEIYDVDNDEYVWKQTTVSSRGKSEAEKMATKIRKKDPEARAKEIAAMRAQLEALEAEL